MQFEILKQHLLLRPVEIVTDPLYKSLAPDTEDLHLSRHPASRALLTAWTMGTYDPENLRYIKSRAWIIIPLYDGDLNITAGSCYTQLRRCSTYLLPETWHNFRLSKILETIQYSKTQYPLLKNFFFEQTTWTFSHSGQLAEMVERSTMQLPRDVLASFRSICVEIGDEYNHDINGVPSFCWERFVCLFEYVIQIISRSDSPLPGITSLEINGQYAQLKLMRDWIDQVVDETIRTRYLVTRCYQLLQVRPNIKIVLSGFSKDKPTKVSPAELPRDKNGHRIRKFGLGYTDEEVAHFYDTIHETLPLSLEITAMPNIWAEDEHFKILFAAEWKKIWELGLESPDNEQGYHGVDDPRLTLSISGHAIDIDLSEYGDLNHEEDEEGGEDVELEDRADNDNLNNEEAGEESSNNNDEGSEDEENW